MTETDRNNYKAYISVLTQSSLNAELDTVLKQIVSKDFTHETVEMLAILNQLYTSTNRGDLFLSCYNARINAVKLNDTIEQEMR